MYDLPLWLGLHFAYQITFVSNQNSLHSHMQQDTRLSGRVFTTHDLLFNVQTRTKLQCISVCIMTSGCVSVTVTSSAVRSTSSIYGIQCRGYGRLKKTTMVEYETADNSQYYFSSEGKFLIDFDLDDDYPFTIHGRLYSRFCLCVCLYSKIVKAAFHPYVNNLCFCFY